MKRLSKTYRIQFSIEMRAAPYTIVASESYDTNLFGDGHHWVWECWDRCGQAGDQGYATRDYVFYAAAIREDGVLKWCEKLRGDTLAAILKDRGTWNAIAKGAPSHA